MKIGDIKKYGLPESPGVYFFKKGREILYIGKATSLKDRVRSYFANDLIRTRGSRLVSMLVEADTLSFTPTDSVLEALILEAEEIRKHQPKYNAREKDNKSFSYVVITKEPARMTDGHRSGGDFPQVLIVRGRDLKFKTLGLSKIKASFGPFPHGMQLRDALKIIRRIFPFRDAKCKPGQVVQTLTGLQTRRGRPCFNRQIGLCPGVCTGEISKQEYAKTIRHIILFFRGKKKAVIRSLEQDMKKLARAEKFEEAEKVKRTIFALNHIQDVALLKNDLKLEARSKTQGAVFRIEAYDIAHISGTDTVGVMVVVEDGEALRSDYRKFRIRGAGKDIAHDIANLKEILRRRLGHAEWPLPNLIVVDGSTAQINAAKGVIAERGFNIDISAVTKDERHKAKDIIGQKNTVESWGRAILLANSEAHRFAINYHRHLRSKRMR